MPTLSELPQTVTTQDSDLALVERDGVSYVTTMGALREPMQPRLTLATGKLLGRVSVFPGSPEPVNIGTGLKIDSGTLMVDQATLPSTNASSLSVIASGSTRNRSLAARFAERVNVLDFGARADGVTNDGPAIQAAIDSAASRPRGAEVFLPPGTYRIDPSFAIVRPRSNVLLRGAGRGRTVLFADDAIGAINGDCISNSVPGAGSTWFPLSDFHVRDLTMRGRADQLRIVGCQMLRLNGTNLTIENCEFMFSRNMGMVIAGGRDVAVRNCRVWRTIADGIAVWDTDNVIIEGNQITGANDDAISVHCATLGPAPLRSGVVIANNTITESQGIAALGLKSAVISNNVMRRIMGTGIRVWAPSVDDPQGRTPEISLRITNNILQDVFLRGEPNARSLVQFYILVSGGQRNPGTGAVPPGEPAPGTGAVTPLYGSGTGSFYGGDIGNPAVAAPAGHWIDISGNTLVRTLPAVANVSAWGYATEGLWVGDNGDGSGFYNGPITESQLNTMAILLGPALRNCRIADNTIQTTGPHGILLNSNTIVTVTTQDLDYDGLTIEGNRIADVSVAAIQGPTRGSHRVLVRGNELDGDPLFRSANRSAGGRWASATGGPDGVLLAGCSGFVVSGNSFRNLATAVRQTGAVSNIVAANTLHCDPSAVGFSTANRGMGTVEPGGAGWLHVIETCDPSSAQYGRIRATTVTSAAAMPTAGTYVAGHFVACTAPAQVNRQSLTGWLRLTTGSGHVAGTDWSAIYGLDGGTIANPKITVFTASATWTRDPASTQVEVEVWGGGGAGGNGGLAASATAVSGGGGGGGGGKRRGRFRALDLPASVAVTVGTGGTRGTGAGAAGNGGGTSSFGALLRAYGGGGGAGGGSGASGGGGGAGDTGAGSNGTGSTAGAGGAGFGASGGSGAPGGSERIGGGGGAGGIAGGAGQQGGYAAEAGGGGGSGGGVTAANVALGGGGTQQFNLATITAGGAAPGGAGTSLPAFTYGIAASQGGPGGAGSATGAGGNGADGQSPGGGGGGGGAAVTGQSHGAGGNGGSGIVIVYEW